MISVYSTSNFFTFNHLLHKMITKRFVYIRRMSRTSKSKKFRSLKNITTIISCKSSFHNIYIIYTIFSTIIKCHCNSISNFNVVFVKLFKITNSNISNTICSSIRNKLFQSTFCRIKTAIFFKIFFI